MASNRQEQMKELGEKLEQGVRDIFANGFAEYLHFASGFYNYSARNTQLILTQKPDATMVAGFSKWKEMGRSVNKGEHGILIMAPMPSKHVVEETQDKQGYQYLDSDGKPVPRKKEITETRFAPVYVFDISQTSGREVPLNNAALEYSELSGDVKDYNRFFEGVKRASPFPIRFDETGEAEGFTSFRNQEIVLQSGKSQYQNLSVAFHEMAHAALHDPAKATETKSKEQKEVEAEGVSFVLSEYFGIPTGSNSFAYIAEWSASQELDVLKNSLVTIQRTASDLINDIEKHYKEICKEQPQQSQETITTEQAANQLLDSYELPNTPDYRPVFGEQEKAAVVTYAKHQTNFDQVALLVADMAEKRYELTYGHVNPDVLREINIASSPIKIDTPFIPTLEVTSENTKENGAHVFDVWDRASNSTFTVDEENRDGFYEINTLDLDTGESITVGLSTTRSYNFEINTYRDMLFDRGEVLGQKNIHFEDVPGRWSIDSALGFKGQDYYLASDMDKQSPGYHLIDPNGTVLRENVFADKPDWGIGEFRDLIANTLAEQNINRANAGSPAPLFPPPHTTYSIFQPKDSTVANDAPNINNYECIHIGLVYPEESLDDIYSKFQSSDLPPDYFGKPMTPGDIIVLDGEQLSAFLVQESGIVPCPEYFDVFRGKIDYLAPNGNAVETRYYSDYQKFLHDVRGAYDIGQPIHDQHMSKQDYDREVKQVAENQQQEKEQSEPVAPTVAALEADVKAGKTISLLDLANAVKAEQKPSKQGKRTSLSERVSRAKVQSEKQQKLEPSITGSKKSKEMEL